MKVTALAPWFGAKRNMAKSIIDALGQHRAYWEPFCGSMAVLLAKEPATMETVNDLHGDLVNLARVVKSEQLAASLYGEVSRVLMSEKLFKAEAAAWREIGHQPAGDTPDLVRAVRFFVCSWMGMNGVAGTQSYNQGFCARFTKNGGHAGTRFVAAVESIPAWHERLRTVTILDRDAFDVIGKIEDAEGVVIYCDPPYLVKGAKYVHDFTELVTWTADAKDIHSPIIRIDKHEVLARMLARFKRTRVVVSYYEHPRLSQLYPGWRKIDCATTKAMVSSGKRDAESSTKAPEVLLINEPDKSDLF